LMVLPTGTVGSRDTLIRTVGSFTRGVHKIDN